jgi:hypothetical protein
VTNTNNTNNTTMKILNYTPHEIVVHTAETTFTFPPSGKVARVSSTSKGAGSLAGIPCFTTTFGEVEGLPAPEEGVAIIVSGMVMDACKGKRFDLVAPGELVRNAEGQPIGCKGFRV